MVGMSLAEEIKTSEQTPMWQTLGITVVDAEDGRARVRLPISPGLGTYGRPDVIHGGAIASLIDAAGGIATRSTRPAEEAPWRGIATTDLSVSYLDAAMTDLVAEGRVLRVGRTIAFVNVEVRDASEKLVAVGRVTNNIRRAE
jgi:uncharacterized protein (TIGR00369 family)